MSFEIEKKFLIGDFDTTLSDLKKDFGDCIIKNKSSFWFASYSGDEYILKKESSIFLKKDVEMIRYITEFDIPIQDFSFLRLRIMNDNNYIITFKLKNIVDGIEKNIEYEYELSKDVLFRIITFLKEKNFIFYYNIKKSYEFISYDNSNDNDYDKKYPLKIELSSINNLKNNYLEVELIGEDSEKLVKELEKRLVKFSFYDLKEESRNYVELFLSENRENLKFMKVSHYSKDGYKELNTFLNINI